MKGSRWCCSGWTIAGCEGIRRTVLVPCDCVIVGVLMEVGGAYDNLEDDNRCA